MMRSFLLGSVMLLLYVHGGSTLTAQMVYGSLCYRLFFIVWSLYRVRIGNTK